MPSTCSPTSSCCPRSRPLFEPIRGARSDARTARAAARRRARLPGHRVRAGAHRLRHDRVLLRRRPRDHPRRPASASETATSSSRHSAAEDCAADGELATAASRSLRARRRRPRYDPSCACTKLANAFASVRLPVYWFPLTSTVGVPVHRGHARVRERAGSGARGRRRHPALERLTVDARVDVRVIESGALDDLDDLAVRQPGGALLAAGSCTWPA